MSANLHLQVTVREGDGKQREDAGRDEGSMTEGKIVEKKKCSKNAKISQNGNRVLSSRDRMESRRT